MLPQFMYSILTFGLAGIAGLVALFILVRAFILFRLQRDARMLRDAEERKSVDLSALIVAHVPPGRRTNNPDEEIRFAVDAVAAKLASGRRTLAVSAGLLIVLVAGTGAYAVLGKPGRPPVVRRSTTGAEIAAIDALKALPGTWGWKYNALLSCKENPHTIVLSSDKKELTIRFRTPLPTDQGPVPGYDYEIVRAGPSELVLRLRGESLQSDMMGRPLEWSMHMDDRNTYYLKRSDVATQDTGLIARCSA
ncbi:MAG: hypothetical protein ACJ8AI_16795 [Rhodopila sp.]